MHQCAEKVEYIKFDKIGKNAIIEIGRRAFSGWCSRIQCLEIFRHKHATVISILFFQNSEERTLNQANIEEHGEGCEPVARRSSLGSIGTMKPNNFETIGTPIGPRKSVIDF